jgi:hypothetical protein
VCIRVAGRKGWGARRLGFGGAGFRHLEPSVLNGQMRGRAGSLGEVEKSTLYTFSTGTTGTGYSTVL